MTTVAEAEALIFANMPAWPAVEAALADCGGRVLAEPAYAERDQPPFDRVTMDGIAIAHRDWRAGTRRYEIVGLQAAGAAAMHLTGPGQCVRIMTGAMCPQGADTVIPVERVEIASDHATVGADTDADRGQFIHRRGSDRQAGQPLLPAGARIGPPEMAILASAGYARPQVAALPKLAVISTGDELVGLEEPLAPYQIRSSNDFAIEASLRRHRLADPSRTRLADDEAELVDRIDALHRHSDALILSGGVSMGEFDFVPAVLQRLGARVLFHRVEQRPGRPMWFGLSADAKPIFALPGNPVSALVCMTRYVLPALRRAAGLPQDRIERVALTAAVAAPKDGSYFVPVKVRYSEQATALAEPEIPNTSGDFVSLAGTDGFVELPPAGQHPPGTVARLFRW